MKLSVILLACVGGFVLECTSGHSTEYADITNHLVELDRQVKSVAQENADLIRKVNRQETELFELKSDNRQMRKLLDTFNLENKTDRRNKRILLMNQQPPMENHYNKPAFSVRLTKTQTSLGNQQTIKFDKVEINVGNGYSPMSGLFEAPTNGTYFFFASTLTPYAQHLETEIVHNGRVIAQMYCYGPEYDQGSNGAVVNVKENDLVWVRHQGTVGNNIFGSDYSSFSGFQL